MVVGLLLLGLGWKANSEFTQMASSATSPNLEDLSVPTKIVLNFVPATEVAPGQAASPADFASMINTVMIVFIGGGCVLILVGAYFIVTGISQRSENSET